MQLNGLTTSQVQQQIEKGNINKIPQQSDRTVKQIVHDNVCTYFNLIFLIISILLIIAGSFKSLTFLPVVIANTVIGIIQQLRSKKVLDELSVLDKTNYTVVRDGEAVVLPSDELVLNDIVLVKAGQQIPADGNVVQGKADVNESLLTGEADEIEKKIGSDLKSGSFIVSGDIYMILTNVGSDSYACKLMTKAKKVTEHKSEMIRDIELIIKIAGVLIIPIGLLLLIQSLMNGNGFSDSIVSMVGAVIGMIPEGMYLLTTVALALSSMRLAQKQVLLHDMHSILKNPIAANQLIEEAENRFQLLSINATLNPIISDEVLKSWGIRFIKVNNYLAFYRTDEVTRTVYIIRFLYGKSNWNSILKRTSHF